MLGDCDTIDELRRVAEFWLQKLREGHSNAPHVLKEIEERANWIYEVEPLTEDERLELSWFIVDLPQERERLETIAVNLGHNFGNGNRSSQSRPVVLQPTRTNGTNRRRSAARWVDGPTVAELERALRIFELEFRKGTSAAEALRWLIDTHPVRRKHVRRRQRNRVLRDPKSLA